MNPEYLIMTFGYAAVILGTFLEGETVLVIAGYLAHSGYIKLPLVILSAFIGSFAGDELYFFIGRTKGQEFIDRKPGWKEKTGSFRSLLDRFHAPVIVGNRFLYGLRIAGPIVIGMSDISSARFIALNAVGALLWSVLISSAGYLFGHTIEAVLSDIKHYEHYVVLFIILISFTIFMIRHFRKHNSYNR